MSLAALNWVDYVFITIFILSLIVGLSRGLVREIIALITLIAAVFIAVGFSQQLAMHFAVDSGGADGKTVSYLALTVSFMVLFVGTIVIGTLLGYVLSLGFNYGGVGFVNQFLGGVFGIIRAAIFSVVIMFVVQMSPAAENPQWQTSQFVMLFQPAVIWLNSVASPSMKMLKEKLDNRTTNEKTTTSTPVEDINDAIEKLTKQPTQQ